MLRAVAAASPEMMIEPRAKELGEDTQENDGEVEGPRSAPSGVAKFLRSVRPFHEPPEAFATLAWATTNVPTACRKI